jgi:hypothetical protein
MMTVSKVFRSPNSDWTLGFEFIVFDENLFSPSTSCTRRFQICVGKNDEGMFRVYVLAIKEDKILTTRDILSFPCLDCAKAFAQCLVSGDNSAACSVHKRSGFNSNDLVDGRLVILHCLMGLDEITYDPLDDDLKHRLSQVVRLVSDGQLTWEQVIRAWEFAEQFAKQRNISLDGALSVFCAEAMKIGR